jgi:hypothetical protein
VSGNRIARPVCRAPASSFAKGRMPRVQKTAAVVNRRAGCQPAPHHSSVTDLLHRDGPEADGHRVESPNWYRFRDSSRAGVLPVFEPQPTAPIVRK